MKKAFLPALSLLSLLLIACPQIVPAQTRWELQGPITGHTAATLPTPGTAGKVRRLTDGGATGALVVDDGTTWNCLETKSQKVVMVTCPPYNAKGDGVTNDSAAFTAAFATSPKTVLVPPGTFLVGNLTMKSGLRLIGAGAGVTTLKLPNATQASVLVNFEALPLTDVEVAHLTIDGNGANQVSPSYAAFAANGITRFWFHDLHVKNSIEYCIGLEGGTHQGKISDVTIENCRWDGIDIKNGGNNTKVEITNVSIHNVGTSSLGSPRQPLSTCLDSGGSNKLSNIHCTGLTDDSYGFGFRRHQTGGTNCDVAFCQGGEGSSLTNFFVSGDGSTTMGGAGMRIRDDYIQISNGYITGVGKGVWIETDGEGTASHVTVSNVSVTNVLSSGFFTNALSSFASFINCVVTGAGEYGFALGGGNERVIGGSVRSATLDGILVAPDKHNVKIMGTNLSSNTLRGVSIGAGAEDTLVIGNTFAANTGGPLSDAGTRTLAQGNRGLKTRNSGLNGIASGATSMVLSHGLDVTPALENISISPTNDPTNAVRFWFDTVTATQFTVHVSADPGASGAYFAWQVQAKE